MLRNKRILLIIVFAVALFLIPSICNATDEITVTRNIYSMDGSMKFTFEGLTIDKTHEYEYGLTKISATQIEDKDWCLVTESTETSVTVNIMTGTKQMREVINAVDTGYITIKDKTTNTISLEPYAVDLKLPYLRVTNYEVVSNGQKLDGDYEINVPLRNAANSEAYYKYEKITDNNLINKYKEVKANNGDYTILEDMLKTNPPTSGYSSWGYWNGHGSDGRNGFGYTTRTVTAPDEGLYYLWVYFSGESIKNLYGCILVDNLQPDIAIDSVLLPETKTVELGKTITLYPTFNPPGATNKIVTWTSSDESVATVNNAGVITPKKVGSTIITVITQDGNKKATCTVTVTSNEDLPKNDEPTTDTTQYISFPFIIFNGKSSLDVKNYNGNYKLYYQFVEINDNQFDELEKLKEKYKKAEITYAEFLTQYKQILPSYDDTSWIETSDGKFEKNLSDFNGTKKFVLWAKLVMDTKTVYEAEVYTMDGSGAATNVPDEINKVTDKDQTEKEPTKDTTTKNDTKLPQTGIALLSLILISLIAVAVISKVKYGKYKDI